MTVYVDQLFNWGWMIRGAQTSSCHMVADTDEELHAMAEAIGLRRSWAQHMDNPNQYRRHYDLTPSKRSLARAAGAEELALRDFGRLIKKGKADAEQRASKRAN